MNRAMKQAITWVKDFWYSLPQGVQCCIVVFAAGAGASLGKAFSDPAAACWAKGCLKHDLGAAVGAGIVALRAFYMRPGPGRAGGPSYEGVSSKVSSQ